MPSGLHSGRPPGFAGEPPHAISRANRAVDHFMAPLSPIVPEPAAATLAPDRGLVIKVVGYVRVSLDSPVEDVLAAVEQEDAILAWSKATGHHIVQLIVDEGEAASDGIEGRIGLAEVLTIIGGERAHGLVVARLDRLSSDLIRQEQLIADVSRRGRVFSAAPDDAAALAGADPDRQLIRAVLASVPEFQGALRTLRIRHRLGKAPMPADLAQAALSRIEHMNDAGASLREISQSLAAEGFSPRHSHIWDLGGLRRIVSRLGRRRAADPVE